MNVVLRPSNRVIFVVFAFLTAFTLLILYAAYRNQSLWPLAVFLPPPLVLAVFVLIGRRSRMILGRGTIEQTHPFSKRMSWCFQADEIRDWSEISYDEMCWHMLEPDDREDMMKKPDGNGWQARLNRCVFFRLDRSGEIIQIDMTYSYGKNAKPLRQWFEEHVGSPKTDNDGLYWLIDKKRDKRCVVKRAIREEVR